MDTQKFVDDFASLLRKMPRGTLSAETRFKELPDWNSLLALSLIALVEDEYDVLLKSTDIRDAETLGGLAAVVAKQL